MTKKEMEKKIADLEAKVTELSSALLTLSLRTLGYVVIPTPQPNTNPYIYPANPSPIITDPVYPYGPTTTCGNGSYKQQNGQVIQ